VVFSKIDQVPVVQPNVGSIAEGTRLKLHFRCSSALPASLIILVRGPLSTFPAQIVAAVVTYSAAFTEVSKLATAVAFDVINGFGRINDHPRLRAKVRGVQGDIYLPTRSIFKKTP
jgi:hypothetical protein